jgi:putative intracellular protease/amidase
MIRHALWLVGLLCCGCPVAAPGDGLAPSPVTREEHAASVAALKRASGRARPLIALVTSSSGTETTDLLVPFGVLRRADVADVVMLAERTDPLELMPALTVTPQQAYADFSAQHPEGADYLIVPAMMNSADPVAQAFIKAQHDLGATIIGICSGARVLAAAGLLEERRATAHWADIVDLTKAHPTMTWVRDRRYVVDREVMTTTGVTASVPASLALVEAIAGAPRAREVADALGVSSWLEDHDSDAFFLTGAEIGVAAGNIFLGGWNKERLRLEADDGIDEVGLALEADAWSRPSRSRGAAVTAAGRTIITRGGLQVATEPSPTADFDVPSGVPALDRTLTDIEHRFGTPSASFVAVQLEYPLCRLALSAAS